LSKIADQLDLKRWARSIARRSTYDNMKTAVEMIFIGKGRL